MTKTSRNRRLFNDTFRSDRSSKQSRTELQKKPISIQRLCIKKYSCMRKEKSEISKIEQKSKLMCRNCYHPYQPKPKGSALELLIWSDKSSNPLLFRRNRSLLSGRSLWGREIEQKSESLYRYSFYPFRPRSKRSLKERFLHRITACRTFSNEKTRRRTIRYRKGEQIEIQDYLPILASAVTTDRLASFDSRSWIDLCRDEMDERKRNPEMEVSSFSQPQLSSPFPCLARSRSEISKRL